MQKGGQCNEAGQYDKAVRGNTMSWGGGTNGTHQGVASCEKLFVCKKI